MAFKWYVIRTYSGHENKVKTNLDKIVQSRGMQDRIGQVNIPTIKVAEMKNGKKRVVEKKFMPGYILAELALDDEIQYMISRLPSVAGFVGSPEPEPLSEEEVRNLLQGEVSSEEEEAPAGVVERVVRHLDLALGPGALEPTLRP